MEQEAEASMRKNRGARCRKPVIARGHFIARSNGTFTRTVSSAAGTRASRSLARACKRGARVHEQKRKQCGVGPRRRESPRGEEPDLRTVIARFIAIFAENARATLKEKFERSNDLTQEQETKLIS